ncbi:Vitamin D 25-hydroxylase [Varanus komodoensis]|nr:Vitamin D 25-hydroxylase [Varanus komodoensis]
MYVEYPEERQTAGRAYSATTDPKQQLLSCSSSLRSDPIPEQHHRITADGDCSQEIKRCLLLGRKAMTNLDSILKSRDITLPTKASIVKALVFPVAMYGCESWTIRKAERRRIEAFELWCWRRLLRVPWTARRSNQSVLEEINPDCSLEGQILKLKLKYFGHLMRRKDSLEKSLMLGTIDGKRRRGRQRMRWLDGVTEGVGLAKYYGNIFTLWIGHSPVVVFSGFETVNCVLTDEPEALSGWPLIPVFKLLGKEKGNNQHLELSPDLDGKPMELTEDWSYVRITPSPRQHPGPSILHHWKYPDRLQGQPHIERVTVVQVGGNQCVFHCCQAALLQGKTDSTTTFSEDNLVQGIADLLVAGVDTLVATLSWALLFTVAHPNIQEKVPQELVPWVPPEQSAIKKRRKCPTPMLRFMRSSALATSYYLASPDYAYVT